MLIQNVFLENQTTPTDIRVTNGLFEEIGPGLAPPAGGGNSGLYRKAGAAALHRVPRPSGHLPDGGRAGLEPVGHPL